MAPSCAWYGWRALPTRAVCTWRYNCLITLRKNLTRIEGYMGFDSLPEQNLPKIKRRTLISGFYIQVGKHFLVFLLCWSWCSHRVAATGWGSHAVAVRSAGGASGQPEICSCAAGSAHLQRVGGTSQQLCCNSHIRLLHLFSAWFW